MRLAAAALASLAFVSSAGAVEGDWATASASGTTVSLRLHYMMTCGQPGAGPLVVRLPAAFRVTNLRVTVRGVQRPAMLSNSTVTIDLPKPPQVTCMSIGPGVLPVTLKSVRLPTAPGTYAIAARVASHRFIAQLRVG